jgi:hypothetical protein
MIRTRQVHKICVGTMGLESRRPSSVAQRPFLGED